MYDVGPTLNQHWFNIVRLLGRVSVENSSRSCGAGAVVKAAWTESWGSQVRTPLWHSSFKETNCFFPAHSLKIQYCGEPPWPRSSSASDRHQGANFESCVWWAVSNHSSHHLQEVILAQFSLYVHKRGHKSSIYFIVNAFVTCHNRGNITNKQRVTLVLLLFIG